jgi:hypothetical protein
VLTGYLNIWLPAAGLCSLIFAYLATRAIDHLRARRWPRCMGTIVESVVEADNHDSGGGACNPRVRFTYVAGGLSRESRHFAFHTRIGSRAEAEAVIAKYPVGSAVTVHHHPSRPEQAVLEPGSAALSVAVAAFAGLLFLGSVVTWLGASWASG